MNDIAYLSFFVRAAGSSPPGAVPHGVVQLVRPVAGPISGRSAAPATIAAMSEVAARSRRVLGGIIERPADHLGEVGVHPAGASSRGRRNCVISSRAAGTKARKQACLSSR
jgi:hypothetical protein